MAAAAKKQAEPEPEGNPNLAIWDALSKTDPGHTKAFSRAGGFKGTAIKPIWIVRRLTEQFGPCGLGWGIGEPQFQVVPAGDEMLVFCTVECWHGDPSRKLFGVGGDRARGRNKNGHYSDDEAFKKAFTDAVGNAFKFIGVGADVHMGQFDDSKYVEQMRQEFASGPPANDTNGNGAHKDDPFPQGPCKNKTELKTKVRDLWRDVEAAGDADELEIIVKDPNNGKLIDQLRRALPDWWEGRQEGNMPFEGLGSVIARKQTEFAAAQAEGDDWRNNPLNGG